MSNKVLQTEENAFDEVIAIIDNARENAFRAVNRELINMYWKIGEYVSRRVAEGGWGKSIIKVFSELIQKRYTGIKGFSVSNIWRMKQFYETYYENEKLATLLRELTWSHNLLIMPCKTEEERWAYTLHQKGRDGGRVRIKPKPVTRFDCRIQTTSTGQENTGKQTTRIGGTRRKR